VYLFKRLTAFYRVDFTDSNTCWHIVRQSCGQSDSDRGSRNDEPFIIIRAALEHVRALCGAHTASAFRASNTEDCIRVTLVEVVTRSKSLTPRHALQIIQIFIGFGSHLFPAHQKRLKMNMPARR
jgi:hypothetical protein